MITKLTENDKQTIIDFCLKKEKENLFILGTFKFYKNPFKENQYFGYFNKNKLIGLSVYFGRFGSFSLNAPTIKIIFELVDFIMAEKIKIGSIPILKNTGK